MTERRSHRLDCFSYVSIAAAGIGLLTATDACRKGGEARTGVSSPASLRMGVASSGLSTSNPTAGVRQLAQLLSVEGLAAFTEDGRFEPGIAENWTLSNNGRSLIVRVRSGVTFHDGSPVDAQTLAAVLPNALRDTALGPLFEDVDHVRVADSNSIEIGFRRPSPLLLESLEVRIQKPGPAIVATGPFMVAGDSTNELRANPRYYRGPPRIDDIRIVQFPAVRTAWAELLRNRIDMLYDVGPDALDSLEGATNVGVFTFIRKYQYMIVLNTQARALRPPAIRRALNLAVDRTQLVRQALNQHGVPSSGPIQPHYWALQIGSPSSQFDPQQAANILGAKHVRFTCLIAPDQVYERIALDLKRQFAAVGVDMDVRSVSQDEMFAAVSSRSYDAVLFDGVGGPTLLRPYQLWHSGGIVHPSTFGNATVDAAFDRVRLAKNEVDYRQAVARLQQAFADDPPAIFLAWSERARAVSKRFVVTAEPDRDILATMHLLKPANDERRASRN